MIKPELIEVVAKETGLARPNAEKAVNAFISSVEDALAKGDKVALAGFGTFSVSKREERTGRNPQTGKPIKIKACKLPKFKAGKTFKEAVA